MSIEHVEKLIKDHKVEFVDLRFADMRGVQHHATFPKSIVEPNLDIWSADHCSVYPPLVDGILFSNRKLDLSAKPYMADVMPTLLGIYGVQPTTQLDGRDLLPAN